MLAVIMQVKVGYLIIGWSHLNLPPLEFNSKLALSNAKIIHKWRETTVAQIIRDSHFLRDRHLSQSAGEFKFYYFAVTIT